ncbi:MAG TPA: acyl-CoA dehydrogenase family protein [Bradyrhizobium sp.]|nr:acyl-CoA dehydrogenase family protein [Bradyrhizobium sp.]
MANPQATRAARPDYAPPPIDGDFYRIANVLNEQERALLRRVREFTEGVVAPVIEEYWGRDEFPFAIIPKMAEIGIGGIGYQGYGAAGGNWMLNGFVSMELARVDSSIATFWGVIPGCRPAQSIYAGTRRRSSAGCPP